MVWYDNITVEFEYINTSCTHVTPNISDVDLTQKSFCENTHSPTSAPTEDPTIDPTIDPTSDPTIDPTSDPTKDPTTEPTISPTNGPVIAYVMDVIVPMLEESVSKKIRSYRLVVITKIGILLLSQPSSWLERSPWLV